ncbi:MAG: Serine arginine-rich splicing factor, partial [Paramarteilia canceri]
MVSSRASKRLYVGNLSRDAVQEDLWRLFEHYKPRKVSLKCGYAFVEFSYRADCYDALYSLDNSRICDSRVKLEIARIPRDSYSPSSRRSNRNSPYRHNGQRSDYRLVVKNISSRTTWKDLKHFVLRFCNVCHVDANHKAPGEAELLFDSKSDTKYAFKKLNGMSYNGRQLKVYFDDNYD